MSDTYTRFRLGRPGIAIVASGYRPQWWQQIIGTTESSIITGFNIRDKSQYAQAEIGAPPTALCIAPDIPGSRAQAPFSPQTTDWRLYVPTTAGVIFVFDRTTLELERELSFPCGRAPVAVAGKYGVLFSDVRAGQVAYYSPATDRVLDHRVLGFEPVAALWLYSTDAAVDQFLLVAEDGSLRLLAFDPASGRLTVPSHLPVRAPAASLVDLRSFVTDVPDAWPWYGAPGEVLLLTAGPVGGGQTTRIDVADTTAMVILGADRTDAAATVLSRVGADGTRIGTVDDIGEFPGLEPWYPLTRLVVADPGIDRVSRFLAIQGRQGDVVVGGALDDSAALLAAFTILVQHSGFWQVTAAGGETQFITGIPWQAGISCEKLTFFLAGVVVVNGPADIINVGGFVTFLLKSPATTGQVYSATAGIMSGTPQADTFVFATHPEGVNPNYFVSDGVVTQFVTDIPYDASLHVKTASAASSTVWIARNRAPIDTWSAVATPAQTIFTTTLPFTGFGRSVTTVAVFVNGVKLNSLAAVYTITNSGGFVRITFQGGAPVMVGGETVSALGQNTFRFVTGAATISNVGGFLAADVTGLTAGEQVEVIVMKAKETYTVAGTGAKTLRLRVRGYFEACSFSGGTRIDPSVGNPGRCYRNVTLGGGTPDALFLAVGADTYLMNARGIDPATGLQVSLYDVYDYVVDIPVVGGQVITATYDIRADIGVRSALPLTNRQEYIPADDDPGLPLIAFDPVAPVAGISIQIDILRIIE